MSCFVVCSPTEIRNVRYFVKIRLAGCGHGRRGGSASSAAGSNWYTICEQLISILINFSPQLTFGILIRFCFLLELVFLDYCLIEEFFTTALIISRLYQDTLHTTEIKE